MVAARTINTFLSRIQQNISLQRGLSNILSDPSFLGERFSRRLILYEFHALQKPQAAHLADVRVAFQPRKRFT